LVARAAASLIWQRCFKSDPFSRSQGGKWASLQAHGGLLPPSAMVAGMLDGEPASDDALIQVQLTPYRPYSTTGGLVSLRSHYVFLLEALCSMCILFQALVNELSERPPFQDVDFLVEKRSPLQRLLAVEYKPYLWKKWQRLKAEW
jgi:hypothetical protein